MYVDKGQMIGTLEKVENVCSVKDYLAKLPTSSNDDQIVARVDGDQDTFHLEVTDEAERQRLLKEKLCFDDKCDVKEWQKWLKCAANILALSRLQKTSWVGAIS